VELYHYTTQHKQHGTPGDNHTNEGARAASWTAASDMSYPVRTPGYRDDDPDLLLAIALSKSLMARPPR